MKHGLALIILLFFTEASADWLEKGKVQKVISGNVFTYYGYKHRTSKKYLIF